MNAKGNSNPTKFPKQFCNTIKTVRAEGEFGFSQQLYMCLFKQAVLSFVLRISKRTK